MRKSAIQKQAEKIDSAIRVLVEDKKNLQDKCLHKKSEKTYGASTGNYDPSADSYWTNFSCPECGKRWRVDGSV